MPPIVQSPLMTKKTRTAVRTFVLPVFPLTNLSTRVVAMDVAAPVSVYTFPKMVPRKMIENSDSIIELSPLTYSSVNATSGLMAFVSATMIAQMADA